MPLDLEYDSAYEDWCNDCWDIWMPPPRRRTSDIDSPNRPRTIEETIILEWHIMNECTDLSPDYWIKIYAKRFRQVMEYDSSITKSQIKRILYCNEPIGNI